MFQLSDWKEEMKLHIISSNKSDVEVDIRIISIDVVGWLFMVKSKLIDNRLVLKC